MKSKQERYRNRRTGETGYLCEDEGFVRMRLDLPNSAHPVYRSMDLAEWEPEVDARPWTRSQLARIAFAADLQLCSELRLHLEARKKWENLTDRERLVFMDNGPKGQMVRKVLFKAVMEALEPLAK